MRTDTGSTVGKVGWSGKDSVAIAHCALPGIQIVRSEAVCGETVADFLERERWNFKLPTICVVNGSPALRATWSEIVIKHDDKIAFVSRPGKSGGSSKTFALVAMIALAVLAPWAGPALVGALGFEAGAFVIGTAGLTWGGLATLGIMVGGTLLINALLAPGATQGINQGPTDQIQQIYSIGASGNIVSPLSVIPVQYGKWKDFPPYAATPWSEYIGNDQYLNLLLCIGCGEYEIEALYIDDTVLWTLAGGFDPAFTDVEQASYGPGEDVTLFPINVTSSSEVSGQELIDPTGDPGSGWIGGFIANASGTQAIAIAVDLIFPSGVFTLSSNGAITSASVPIEVEIRTVDDAGAPTSSYTSLFSQTFTYATRNPQRTTLKSDPLTPARYQVRVRRTDTPLTSTGSNGVIWESLRAFINGPSSFAGVTTQAIRIKATSQVSQSSAKKFGVLRTRKLPVWNGSSWDTIITRSPVWAFYDAATNTDYGAKRPVSKIDFQALVDLDATSTSRGDYFDYVFTSAVIVPEAFDAILKTCRSRHRWLGDNVSIIRDEFRSVPQMLLTDRETVRGSVNLDFIFNSEDQADAVILSYVDENTWAAAQVQYPPNSNSPAFTSTNPTSISIPGIITRDQAYREAAFWYLQSYYRRTNITLETEHDGRLLSFGSAVRVQTEMPQTWGATGIVSNNASGTLTLDPAPDWSDTGTHYIAIRTKTGAQFGPIICTQGSDVSKAVLDSGDLASVETSVGMTLADALDRANGAEDPSFDFGIGTKTAKDCVIVYGRPNGDRVTLSLFVDDERVHSDTLGGTPVGPSQQILNDNAAPVIAGLAAYFGQGTAEPKLFASWYPAPGAATYIAQVSYDSGLTWATVYDAAGNSFSAVVDLAALRLRVAGIGIKHGAWYSVDLAAPTITVVNGIVSQTSLDATLDAKIKQINDQLAAAQQELKKDIDQLGAAANALAARLHEMGGQTIIAVGSRYEQNVASINEVAVVAADATTAVTGRIIDLEATVNDGTTGVSASYSDIIALQSLTGDAAHGNVALASRSTTLEATVNNGTTGVAATYSDVVALQSLTGDASHGNTALATRATNLETTVNNGTSGVAATYSDVVSLESLTGDGTHGNLALASSVSSLTSSLGTTNSNVSTNAAAIASNTGSISSLSSTVSSNYNSLSATGQFKVVAASGTDGATSDITLEAAASSGGTFAEAGINIGAFIVGGVHFSRLRLYADRVQVGAPGITGGDFVTPFAPALVNGSLALALAPTMLPDNSIDARVLKPGAVGNFAFGTASSVARTITEWHNSGSGATVLECSLSVDAGAALNVVFRTNLTATGGSASMQTGFFKLFVNGVDTYTWNFDAQYVGTGWYFEGYSFSFNELLTGFTGGIVTLKVVFERSADDAGITVTMVNPQIRTLTFPKYSLVDISSSITRSITYESTTHAGTITAGSYYTVSGASIGTADVNRRIVVCVGASTVYASPPTCTIGGITAALIASRTTSEKVFIFSATVPTGTTADVVVTNTLAFDIDNVGISVFRLIGYSSGTTVYDIWDDGHTSAKAFSLKTGEMAIACAMGDPATTGFSLSWGGSDTVTENSDAASGTGRYAAYSMQATTDASSNMTMSASGTVPAWAGVLAVFH